MKRVTWAHTRRSLQLLKDIGRLHPDSSVYRRGAFIGIWHHVVERWHLKEGELYISLCAAQRAGMFHATAVRPAPWGASILLTCGELRIVWNDAALEDRHQDEDALAAVIEWIKTNIIGSRIVRVTRRAERAFSLSGRYVRIILRHGHAHHLVLACTERPPEDRCHDLLTQALLWVAHLHGRRTEMPVEAVWLFIPAGCSDLILHRAQQLRTGDLRVHILEYGQNGAGTWDFSEPAGLYQPQEERDYRWPVFGPYRWSAPLMRILELAPTLIRRHPRHHEYDSLRLLGLEFARACGSERDRIQFGVGTPRCELSDDNFDELKTLVDEILYYRCPDSADVHHPYYQLQTERWLESLILDDVADLFPELVSEFVYPQIPVYLGDLQGRVDVLAAARDGSLVVMELKVSQDLNLPLQALDYWGRVVMHNREGDFEKRGYFPDMRISRRNPRIYLVAPVFSFHDSTERLLGFLDPDVEVWKIAVNEGWRAGVRVLRRTRVRDGDPPGA